MNQNQTESKPPSVEEPRDKGLDETACSPSSIPGAAWHDEYLKASDRAIRMERERNDWKSRYVDAVERLEGKLHCADDCKCSGRREVNQLRAILLPENA